jgi:histidinol phosphatase-like PHP family hydrolase
MDVLDNGSIAELLSQKAEETSYPVSKAFRRAARVAFLWPVEAANLVEQGNSLTELPAVGPYLEKVIRAWIENPPKLAKPPEIRQGFLTMTQAKRLLASRRRQAIELKGDLQMHTEWSDGSGSILEMAQAAQARGYEFIAITDHSKGLKIAGGINETELAEQGTEIDAINAELVSAHATIRVLRSIEMNLNPAGDGDMDPPSLRTLDIVLGSFHSALRRTDDQTDRYLAALRHPDLQILGHPQGRVYNYRAGLSADWPRVFALAAELNKAVEIDAYPDRQDLRGELLKLAKKAGCRISIGTDAHHPWQLEFIELGLAAAVMAGIKSDRILNFMPRESLLKWVGEVRISTRRQRNISVPRPFRPSHGRPTVRLREPRQRKNPG